MNKATDYKAFKSAISNFKCPIQNFLYADDKGNIAKHFQGKVNKKWKGQGRFILDGSSSDHWYSATIKQLPVVYNPNCGFIGSANDNPVAETDDYIDGYFSKLRHLSINKHLSSHKKTGIGLFKSMQLDNVNPLAKLALPFLLNEVKNKNNEVYKLLKAWDCEYSVQSSEALIFEKWWETVKELTWDELVRIDKDIRRPDDLVLLNLMISDGNDKYFDRLETSRIEKSKDIVNIAFVKVLKLYKDQGIEKGFSIDKPEITHITQITSFGIYNLSIGGNRNALNAQSKSWGPSWRMIVEFTKHGPKGIGVYPGGQSGNPGASNYKQFVEKWSKGEYYSLNFYKNAQEAGKNGKRIVKLK
jgi:penicillin G amidase